MTGLHIALAILAVLLVLDWRQTLRIARDPARWRETNIVLSPHPSPMQVHAWYVTCAALMALAAWLLPEDIATGIAAVFAIVEAYYVLGNWSIGLKP